MDFPGQVATGLDSEKSFPQKSIDNELDTNQSSSWVLCRHSRQEEKYNSQPRGGAEEPTSLMVQA